jgi:hypothetical protein
MKWRFSDGTVVELGGNVEGATYFAQAIRSLIADPRTHVAIWPEPTETVPLDVDDPAIFDRFLRTEMGAPNRSWMMLELLEAPEVPALPDPPWDDDETESFPMMY